ncbi:MAG: SPOR domain-containing protein [Ignavibacteria bacterium]|nr:SPOR domain-containing protein [Ignavibacteria bacterium]
MKKVFLVFTILSLSLIGSMFIFSCGSGLEDCDCDLYEKFDTVRITHIDTVKTVDTVYEVLTDVKYYVQIGCFLNKNYAERFASEAKENLNVTIIIITSKENLYRIMAGEYKELQKAREMLLYVKAKGYSDAFIRDQRGPVEK